jgi:hypothetical protein
MKKVLWFLVACFFLSCSIDEPLFPPRWDCEGVEGKVQEAVKDCWKTTSVTESQRDWCLNYAHDLLCKPLLEKECSPKNCPDCEEVAGDFQAELDARELELTKLQACPQWPEFEETCSEWHKSLEAACGDEPGAEECKQWGLRKRAVGDL